MLRYRSTREFVSPGQTDSQVDASFELAFRLATRLRRLATSVDFGRAQIWTQVAECFTTLLECSYKFTSASITR